MTFGTKRVGTSTIRIRYHLRKRHGKPRSQQCSQIAKIFGGRLVKVCQTTLSFQLPGCISLFWGLGSSQSGA